jgi:transposase
VWADGGYAGKLVAWIQHHCRIVLEIVRKPEGQRTFEVLPRRWVVERTLSWLVRARGHALSRSPISPHTQPGSEDTTTPAKRST